MTMEAPLIQYEKCELYSTEQVNTRIFELAEELNERYKDANPLFVSFLKGASPFTAALMQDLTGINPDFDPEVDYMIISTYKDGYEAGKPHIVTDLADPSTVKGRLVVMLDDVLDSGATFAFAENHLLGLGAAKVESVVMVQKVGNNEPLYGPATLHAFESKHGEWLIGKGMNNDPTKPDHPEAGRWLTNIVVVLETSAQPTDQT